MDNKNLTYLDFAADEAMYLTDAYNRGLRYNAMVSQAQRVCECYLKHIINRSLLNNNEVMMSHNLRKLYEYVESLGINLNEIRTEVMLLNNFYTHTRYPGRDAYLANEKDVTSAVNALSTITKYLARYF